MDQLRADQNEVAGDVRREQAEQGDEADTSTYPATNDKVAVTPTARPRGSTGKTGLVMVAPCRTSTR
jgi:hypothetical protein